MWNRLSKDEKGFTGLEAAIVLIAFVVVAAVFSYVMLGAGFYTTQKSQEVVHTGVAQASSSVALSGDVIARGAAGSTADQITFYLTNTAGGTEVDMAKTIVSYTDANEFVTKEYNAGANGWVYTGVISNTAVADNLLAKGEKYKVVMTLATFGVASAPTTNEQVKIEVKPPEGAVLTITRTLPAALTTGDYYPVY